MTTGNQIGKSSVTAGSYTNTNLTVNAAGLITSASNGVSPVFARIYSSGTIAATVPNTVLPYDTVVFDTNSFWDTTNYWYLPTFAGYYQVVAYSQVEATGNDQAYLQIYNGNTSVLFSRIRLALTISPLYTLYIKDVVYLNGSTDSIQIQGSSTLNDTTYNYNGTTGSYVDIRYLGN